MLLVVSVLAHAQRDPRQRPRGPDDLAAPVEPLPELKSVGATGSKGPDGNVSSTGELVKPFCFKTLEFCATPGMRLTLWTQYGALQALQAIESPVPFTLFGVRFAAKSKIELVPSYRHVVRGRLQEPLDIDGRLVKGQVELQFQDRKLLHALVGTLAREAVIEGWKLPAGYSFDLQNLPSGSFVLKGPEGAAPATWGEASPGIPTKAIGITQWRDPQGAKNLQLELATTEKVGGLDFGPGSITFLQLDKVNAVRGVVNAGFERGAVKAPRGSSVVLCEGELQTVKTEDVAVRVGAFVTSRLNAVRERSPSGWRNDLYGQKVIDECSEGALLGYTFLPQYCPSCDGSPKVPSLVVVDLKGEPRDAESRAMLVAFPSSKKVTCAPCR